MKKTSFFPQTIQWAVPLLSLVLLALPVSATSLSDIPSPAPSWWGATTGQTASLFADFSEPGLSWDEYVIGDNLALADFTISVSDMQWVDDPAYGPGYQPTSPGEMVFTYDNLMVVTNTKHLVDKIEIKTADINKVKDPIVEAQWGQSGWVDGGIGSIKSKWTWEEKEDNAWILSISADLTPQPDKVRIRLQVDGGSGPVIHRAWAGEKCEPIPEPATVILFGTGMVSVLGTRLRKNGRRL